MLVFNEGLPRSGKSYDTVLHHIVPALKAGRKVFARLNGMENDSCRDALAKWIGKPRAYIDEKLFHVDTAQVVELFRARQDDGLKWRLDESFRNALVVIDEIHEFWVGGSREPMPPENEQFIALHGHYGIDIVVMSQHYKRTHTAVRYRVERKNVFQKLSALGKKGEKMYRQTYYQAIQPDKYERVGGETHSYDEKVFALYHGIVPAVGDNGEEVSQAVYSSGRMTVWKSMFLRTAIAVPLGVFGIWYLFSFFTGGGASLVKDPSALTIKGPANQGEPIPGVVVLQRQAEHVRPVDAKKEAEAEKTARMNALTPEQRYVWDLADKGRIRLAALVGEGNSARGLIEWVGPSQVVIERLSLQQLRDLGVLVEVRQFGIRLQAKTEAIIATAWPYDAPRRDEAPVLYDTSGGVRDRVSDSEPDPSAAAGRVGTAAISYAGQMPVGAGQGGQP